MTLKASPLKLRSRIAGTGAYLPARIMTNADLEKIVDTSDAWIVERTGIKERRIAADDEFTSDMGAKAGRQALEMANLKPEQVDLIIVATFTPDNQCPSTACRIQHALGAKKAGAFDLNAVCSGFLYALVVADQFIVSGLYQNVLVIGSDKNSAVLNWKDRNTCVLFGDGAGAVLLQSSQEGRGLLVSDLGSDGGSADILTVSAGGCRIPLTPENVSTGANTLYMEGREVFKRAVNGMNVSTTQCLKTAGVTADSIKWVVPHQANLRIIDALAQRLDIPRDRIYVNLDRYGNMSAACIPVALHDLNVAKKVNRGDLVLMTAFGGGLTWASAILEW
ncbi:MAG: beta-ketoacyl-ACP synthase III [Verrucomicrobiota bacterium]